jgi:hypothetical protein
MTGITGEVLQVLHIQKPAGWYWLSNNKVSLLYLTPFPRIEKFENAIPKATNIDEDA